MVASALAAVALLLAPVSASALSFVLTPGENIEDIDISSSGLTMAYDGTAESILVQGSVDLFRMTDGSTVGLAAGQVQFSLSLSKDSLLVWGDALNNGTILGSYSNGPVSDFYLIDTGADGNPADDLLLEGSFDSGAQLNITSTFGAFLGGTLGGRYTVGPGSTPDFASRISAFGDLSIALSQFENQAGAANTICSISDEVFAQFCSFAPFDKPPVAPTAYPGLEDFTAQPNVDFTPDPIPEPTTGLLLTLGVAAVARVSGRRRT